MYTELHLNSKLSYFIPESILDLLVYMTTHKKDRTLEIPEHSFFQTPNWETILTSDVKEFDFDSYSFVQYDTKNFCDRININCSTYSNNSQVELFIDWIDQFLDKKSGEFLGFYRHHSSENPIPIYKK